MTKIANRRSRCKSRRAGHGFRDFYNYGRVYNNYGNEAKFENPRFETIVEEVKIQIPLSEESHYEAPKPPKTEPTPQPASQTTNEPEKKGKGWKFWVGLALAGVAAAGIGTYMLNNKK